MREAVVLAADVLLAASVTGVAGGGVDFATLADQLTSASSLTSSGPPLSSVTPSTPRPPPPRVQQRGVLEEIDIQRAQTLVYTALGSSAYPRDSLSLRTVHSDKVRCVDIPFYTHPLIHTHTHTHPLIHTPTHRGAQFNIPVTRALASSTSSDTLLVHPHTPTLITHSLQNPPFSPLSFPPTPFPPPLTPLSSIITPCLSVPGLCHCVT